MKPEFQNIDPYEVPKSQNIFEELPPVENDLTVEDIAKRILDNKTAFESKFNKRKAMQDDYYFRLKKSVSQVQDENPE